MPNEDEIYSKGLDLDEFISAGALDPDLVGPTFSSVPPPTGPTGFTGPTGITG
ncbi:bclA protein, partial [Bacillus pacificus]|nr:bclA protein [Bacillus pacificus]